MQGQQHYGGAIWTNHARERLGQRGLSQDLAAQTFSLPDVTLTGKQPGTFEYQKRFGKSTVTVIAKQNEKYEWIILSCWIDPPLYGTEDYKKNQEYKKFTRTKGWKRWLLTLKKQLFG